MIRAPYLKKVQTDCVKALSEHGEIYPAMTQTFVFIEGKEDFTFWFRHVLPIVRKIKHLSDFKLLYWISAHISYNENMISLNKIYKTQIEKDMLLSQTAINRSIASLKALNVLIPYSAKNRSAVFYVNPLFIWKGDKRHRLKKQEFILRLIRENNLPQKELEILEDIERYKASTRSENHFDFATVKTA
jgi:hypothetical protein